MINRDAALKIKENSEQIIKICAKLQSETSQYQSSLPYQTKQIERLLLDSYCQNKNIQPFFLRSQNSAKHILSEDEINEIAEIISIDDDSIELRLPLLAHKRNGDKMILDILHTLFSTAISGGKSIPQMIHHTIDFTHVYPTKLSRHMVLDNDNYNIRGVINVITIYIGSSDSGLNSWQTHKTILSDDYKMGTYITIKRRNKNSLFCLKKNDKI